MNSPNALDVLIDRHLNGLLKSDEAAELNHHLDTSRDARDRLRSRVALHDALHQHFQDPEALPAISPTASPRPQASRSPRLLLRFVLGALCALGGAIGTTMLWPDAETTPPSVVARVLSSGVEGPTSLLPGPFRAQGHFVEIAMENGAHVALEAGSEVELISADSLRLLRGSLGANVGPEARGFTVCTEGGDIEKGTRFGVRVGETGVRTELFAGELAVHTPAGTHAFRGKQRLILTSAQAPRPLEGDVDPQHFPMPALVDVVPVAQGQFEPGDPFTIRGEEPVQPSEWGGNFSRIVTAHPEISPYQGRGMLQFLSTYKTPEATDRTFCDVNQWVDLGDYKDHERRFHASMFVNRVAGDEETDTRFILMIDAYRQTWSEIGDGASEPAIGAWRSELLTDEDPATWERVALQGELPPGTRYIRINLGPQENLLNDQQQGEIEFDGHFVDHVQLELHMPARPALLTIDSRL